jgi:hypothetical protein
MADNDGIEVDVGGAPVDRFTITVPAMVVSPIFYEPDLIMRGAQPFGVVTGTNHLDGATRFPIVGAEDTTLQLNINTVLSGRFQSIGTVIGTTSTPHAPVTLLLFWVNDALPAPPPRNPIRGPVVVTSDDSGNFNCTLAANMNQVGVAPGGRIGLGLDVSTVAPTTCPSPQAHLP